MLRNNNTHSNNESIIVYKNSCYTVYVCPMDTIFHEDLLVESERNSPHKKQQFFQSRRLLRTLLKDQNLNHKADIIKDIKGKPILKNYSNHGNSQRIDMSISHSKSHVAVAIAKDCNIGIDIENPKDRKYLKKIALKVFSTQENHQLSQCENHKDYLKLFFKYWTKRESLGKAYGIGLIFASNDWNYPESNHSIEWHTSNSYILCISAVN